MKIIGTQDEITRFFIDAVYPICDNLECIEKSSCFSCVLKRVKNDFDFQIELEYIDDNIKK